MTSSDWTCVALWIGLNAALVAWHWHMVRSVSTIAVQGRRRRR
jgi:hypothetical protein